MTGGRCSENPPQVAGAPKTRPKRVAGAPNIAGKNALTCTNTNGWQVWQVIQKFSTRARVTRAGIQSFGSPATPATYGTVSSHP